MDTQQANEIANLTRQQIGEGALFMMGAQYFTSIIKDGNAVLAFRIRGSRIGNCFHITLMPSDTYRVELYKSFRLIDTREDIYCDLLTETLGKMTGLAVSIPRIVGINA